MNHLTIASLTAALVLILFIFTGCTSIRPGVQRNLSETPEQARANIAPTQATADVYSAAISAGQIDKLISSATQNIDKGFRFQDSGKEVARDTKGEVIFIEVPTPSGLVKAPLYVDWSTEVSLSSYVDLANNIEGLNLQVGDLSSLQDGTNQIYRTTPNRNGLSLTIAKAGGAATNAAAITALKTGQADTKAAAGTAVADAIKVDWQGRVEFLSNGMVKLIDATGKATEGILLQLSPYGAAGDLAKVVLKTDTGETISRVIPTPTP